MTSLEGDVFAYTAAEDGAAAAARVAAGGERLKDIRHLVNTRESLRKFCADFLQKPLEDFLETWPGVWLV